MAVDGSMLDKYVGKKIKVILVNEQGILKGTLTKDDKKFFLENKKIKKAIKKFVCLLCNKSEL